MKTTITPEEFEKALARACMRSANQMMKWDPFRKGDETAVQYGAFVEEVAGEAGISIPQVRRRLSALQDAGKVLRWNRRGGPTTWWLVGLAPAPSPQAPTPSLLTPALKMHTTPSPDIAVTTAVLPLRQHWSDVLGVARDCSTSEARDAFRERLAAVPEHDLDAEQQRQRIRDAYNARLTEDGISEYE